ncbi:Glu-tRNA(Gln) amidotransferase GatDE subunit E [Candidatus Pacearchaeota archaeon]|nr:MAG: Glu-tRNA(Gln) amidotransferase GatDE subunit E [Candidatus Pacearchaeota archaeon]
MSEEYKKLKFKCGLEIHQQLDTHKLFCNCPSVLRNDEPDYTVMRKLHAVAGESGKVDIAAEYQAGLNNTYFYQGYKDTNCLIELDEEPPHEINKDALKIALQISILLNAKIIPISQIMRKTVIDGSNTSGFQRTVMIARDGYVETSKGRIKIDGIFLEEDAARVIKKEKNKIIYRLDRLGIPLVEISTSPDIKTPEQAKETALIIGDILRSCKVKRGIGTIRQDINMSIKGKNRIEIKGMQDMRIFLKVIEKEIQRQKELLEEGKKIQAEVRNALPDVSTEFLRPLPGSARMYPETDLPLLKISRDFINEAKKTLPKLRSQEEKELIKKGLNKDMIKLLFKQNKLEEFKELLGIIDNPQLIIKVLLMYPREVAKRQKISLEKAEKILNRDVISFVLESLRKKKISEENIKQVFEKILNGDELEKAIKFEKINQVEIEDRIRKIIHEKPGLSLNAYMGIVMKELRGKINGKIAMEIIKKYV